MAFHNFYIAIFLYDIFTMIYLPKTLLDIFRKDFMLYE